MKNTHLFSIALFILWARQTNTHAMDLYTLPPEELNIFEITPGIPLDGVLDSDLFNTDQTPKDPEPTGNTGAFSGGPGDDTTRVPTHTEKKPFECTICNKRFRLELSLITHLRSHDVTEKRFACNTCGKGFTQKGGLTNHIRIHTGEKPFECTTCKRRFTQKCNLTRHLFVHTGKKPFVCKICNRRFARKYSLKIHRCSAK